MGSDINKYNSKCECHYCKKRYVGCHSHCKSYLQWKKEFLKQKKEEREKKTIDRLSYSSSEAELIYKKKQKY